MELRFFSSNENEFSLFGMSAELFFARPLKSVGKLFTKPPFTTNLEKFLLDYAATNPDIITVINTVMVTTTTILAAYGAGVQTYGIVKNVVVPIVEKVKTTIQSITLPPPVGAASAAATEAKKITEIVASEAKEQADVVLSTALKTFLEKPIPIPDLPSITETIPPEVKEQVENFMSQYQINFNSVNDAVDNILNTMQNLPTIPK